jgi:hypothetical protein
VVDNAQNVVALRHRRHQHPQCHHCNGRPLHTYTHSATY